MKIKILSIIFITISFSGCLRLDDYFFNANETKITSYNLDNYTGEVDFHLDASYKINDSLVHLFKIPSQSKEEATPTNIYALYIGNLASIASDTVILYCHGNKDHMDFYWQRAKLLAHTNGKNNYGVMMIDYRGYGLSEGKPSEAGLSTDVNAALLWLKNKGMIGDRLMMYGFSLGTAPATKLTAHPEVLTTNKLILEAPFASSEVMVQDATGLEMPAAFFTDIKVNNADEIKSVTQPFLWIHGDQDNFLNMETHGQLVFNHYQGIYKEKYIVPGGGHDNTPLMAGFNDYLDVVGKFIRRK